MSDASVKRRAREDRFAAEYLIDMNGSEAMRRMNFAGRRPDIAAAKMLARPRVREMVEKRAAKLIARADVTQERIVEEAARIAYSDPRNYFDQSGALIPVGQLSDHAAAAVSDLEFETIGEGAAAITRVKKLKRWNKVEAVKLLAQIKGLTQPDRPPPIAIFNIQINL